MIIIELSTQMAVTINDKSEQNGEESRLNIRQKEDSFFYFWRATLKRTGCLKEYNENIHVFSSALEIYVCMYKDFHFQHQCVFPRHPVRRQ